jgi:hypothetical protein
VEEVEKRGMVVGRGGSNDIAGGGDGGQAVVARDEESIDGGCGEGKGRGVQEGCGDRGRGDNVVAMNSQFGCGFGGRRGIRCWVLQETKILGRHVVDAPRYAMLW